MEKEKEAISEMISVDKSDTHVDGDLQLSFLCSAQNLNFSLCIQSMSCPICVCISSSTPNCNTIALHSNKLHIQFFKRYLILYFHPSLVISLSIPQTNNFHLFSSFLQNHFSTLFILPDLKTFGLYNRG